MPASAPTPVPTQTDEHMTDPYAVTQESDRAFWADAAADAVETASEPPYVIKSGVSPSGIPHIGHTNELLRGHYVAAALRDRGHEVQEVFTADDRDRLRKLPRRLADLDGEIVELSDVDGGALGRNLGRPYTDVPDPFGCCDSYGDHFTNLLARQADRLGLAVEFVSNTELYQRGAFDEPIRAVLGNREQARELLAAYQAGVGESYVPFFARCGECGQLTETITGVDLEAGTVSYRCSAVETEDGVLDGCGDEGTVSVREGKLPWRFEWPAQWAVLGVDFEPFGKDHAEGSWPSGEQIARELLAIEPPVPMVYEWFTVNGAALSSSAGNVVTVDELLELLEPAVFRYFFAREPLRQRDFNIEALDDLVDEFDRFEAIYFGEREAEPALRARAERAYPMVVDKPDRDRIRLPYTFAAVLGMTDNPEIHEEIARKEGHIPPDASEAAIERALARVERASRWASRTGNAFDYELKRTDKPEVEFGHKTQQALDELAAVVAAGNDGDQIQEAVYETARDHGLDPADLFAAGYQLFFDDTQGPRLGPFLGRLDREFVVARLRRER